MCSSKNVQNSIEHSAISIFLKQFYSQKNLNNYNEEHFFFVENKAKKMNGTRAFWYWPWLVGLLGIRYSE